MINAQYTYYDKCNDINDNIFNQKEFIDMLTFLNLISNQYI